MNIPVAEQKTRFRILSATSTDQTAEIARTRLPRKSLTLLALFLVLILAAGCGGRPRVSVVCGRQFARSSPNGFPQLMP
jgi:hypothetical protein